MSWKLETPAQTAYSAYDLSPRLAALAEWVEPGAAVVDVGTDHGLLPQALMESGRVASAIGVDTSPSAIAEARARVDVDLRVGSLEVVQRGEADTLIIAGMGARRIASILRGGFRQILLQPNTEVEWMRGAVAKAGYRPSRERFVPDGDRFYLIIDAQHGTWEPTQQERFVGLVGGDPLFPRWAALMRGHLQRKPLTPDVVERLAWLKAVVD